MPNKFNLLDYDSDDEHVVATPSLGGKEKPFVLSACPCPKTTVVKTVVVVQKPVASPIKRWADYDTDDDE